MKIVCIQMVCEYCGVLAEHDGVRWKHVSWMVHPRIAPKESVHHVYLCERNKYPLRVVTQDDWKITQVEKALDGLL
jgi:hypothetical protein